MTISSNNLLPNTRWQIFFIAAAILILYFRILSFDFIGLDEQSLLLEKRNFNKELSNIPKAFTQHVFQKENNPDNQHTNRYYRPVLTVSFILDEQFSGESFTVHRISNLIIHFFACLGLLFVLQQLKIPQPFAFFFALLFAAHPLLAQAVAWIPGRNDSLVSAFILWSLYFLTTLKSPIRTVLHLLFFALALLTKENAVVFVVICSYYIFILQPKQFPLRKKLILLSSYGGITLIWLLARQSAIGTASSAFSGIKEGSLPLLFQYFQKTILPVNLSVMSTVEDTNYGWVLITFSLFGAALYFTKDIRWKEILLGLLWFFLFFLPTLLFSYFEGMEHRSYLPMAGLILAFAHIKPEFRLALDGKIINGILASIILIFGSITWTRVPAFENEISYWENAFYSSEHSAVVCRDYGVILTKRGDYENAEKAYLEGIKRNPKEILIHYNLGVMYFKTGHFTGAEQHLLRELQIDSIHNPLSYHLLGLIYKKTGRMKEAEVMWKKALRVDPGFDPAMEELEKNK